MSFIHFSSFQVLTDDTPFHGLSEAEVVDSVVNGVRPTKPQNAPAIGFSESLWDFVQLCWEGDRTRRPAAAEVVKHLYEVAANWRALMPAIVPEPAMSEQEPTNHRGSQSFHPINSNGSPSAKGHPRLFAT